MKSHRQTQKTASHPLILELPKVHLPLEEHSIEFKPKVSDDMEVLFEMLTTLAN
jgi:hypothetical protein